MFSIGNLLSPGGQASRGVSRGKVSPSRGHFGPKYLVNRVKNGGTLETSRATEGPSIFEIRIDIATVLEGGCHGFRTGGKELISCDSEGRRRPKSLQD